MTNRPRCPVCDGNMRKNGTTSKGTTRWRCTTCNATSTRSTQQTAVRAAEFRAFITWATATRTLNSLADDSGTSISTLRRRFTWCWLIHVPHTADPHRVHDQIFIDGTYLAGGCLLIAADTTHVIDWHWCRHETTAAYTHLLTGIPAPLLVTTDGGQGAQSAIKAVWPTAKVQRCLVHVQRVVRRHTTSRPRTPAGKTLYLLALKLTDIHDLDAAANWVARLQEFTTVYADFLNEKTTLNPKDNPTGRRWTWTHDRVRKAHNSLLSVYRRGHLFNYLTVTNTIPTSDDEQPPPLKATTNTLEGGINAAIITLARAHRGVTAEHQRTVIDWWLYLHTHVPDDPVRIAGDQRWGQVALAKAQDLIAADDQSPSEDGRPAIYDTAIDSTYQHSMGVQKGWVGT